jgi:hypothetical protein
VARRLSDLRDFRSGCGNSRVGPSVGIGELRRDDRVANQDRKAASRIVDFTQAFDDERHQRERLAGRNPQGEDVPDVRRIVARVLVCERVRVHVADRRQVPRDARSEDVSGRPMPRWAPGGIGHLTSVLHDRHKGVGEIDSTVAVRGCRDRHHPAIREHAGRAAPCHIDHTDRSRRVGVPIQISKVVRVLRCVEPARHGHAARDDRRDRIEPFVAVVGQSESAQVLIGYERDLVRGTAGAHADLEISETVEGVGSPAGGDAPAVLGPGGGVLDVPELAVSGRKAGDGPEVEGRDADDRDDSDEAQGVSRDHAPTV